MNAERLRVDWDFFSAARDDFSACGDADGLLPCFGWIADESVVVLTGAERAIGFVETVGEGFCGYGETCLTKDLEHGRTGEANENNLAVPACNSFGDRGGEFGIADCLVVKCAVRFDVADFCAEFCRDDAECRNLFENEVGYFAGGKFQFDAAEVFTVGITGMSTDSYVVFLRLADGGF